MLSAVDISDGLGIQNPGFGSRLGTNRFVGSRFGLFWVVREVRGSVLEDEPRFGRFEVRNF